MSGVAEYHSMTFQLYGHGDPLRVTTGVVSDRFFDMLGVKPLLGRTFLPGEEAVGAPPVVMLSHAFWMNQFHGDSSIVGATFTMNDKLHHGRRRASAAARLSERQRHLDARRRLPVPLCAGHDE